MKKNYLTPTVKVVRVTLEKGIAVAFSPVKTDGILLEDWELDAMPEDDGDMWLPI